jgi:hypothetical protein
MNSQRDADPLHGWSEPDDSLVATALSRIGDWQHRRAFFEGLDNPRWVDALDRHGSFRPPSQTKADGDDWWPRWPEGAYLVRMAPMVPGTVARIMTQASTAENPFVHELVLQAALGLPAEFADQLTLAIRDYVLRGTVRDGKAVVELIEKLSEAGLRRSALGIAGAAFRPRAVPQADDSWPIQRNVLVGVDPFWYEELLPQTLSALDHLQDNDALSIASGWLKEFEEVSGGFDPATGSDTSFVWRPAIADDPQNARFGEIGDSLVEAVRDQAINAVRNGRPVADVLAILERDGPPLLERIAMHVLSMTADANDDVREAGYERLMDARLLAIEYRHEYSELARHLLPVLTSDQVAAWQSLILGAPPIDHEALEEAAPSVQQPGETSDDEVRRYRDKWQRSVLSAIGEESLPSSAKARIRELVEQYGELEHADFPIYTSSVTSPTSPVSPDELRSKSVDEVREFLLSWSSESLASPGRSRAALGDVFQLVVSERPDEYSAVADTFSELRPTYVRALLTGLTDGISGGESVNWTSILECVRLVSLKFDADPPSTRRMDEDIIWKAAQLSATRLLEVGATRETSAIPVELLGTAVNAIAPLLHHPDPTPEYEERYGGSNMDPRMLSLNTIRPSTIRAVVQLAFRANIAATNDPTGRLAADVIEPALHLLTSRVKPDRDESIAVAAAFGDALASLIWIDPNWTEDQAEFLLTSDHFGDVVLSTALGPTPSPALLDLVTPAAQALLDRAAAGETPPLGSRTARTTVELIGAISVDHPLLLHFFEFAPVASRSSVLGQLGWLIMRAEDVPNEVLQRAMALWDSRADAVERGESSAEELSGFYWWVRAEKFRRSWWLPRLEQAVSSDAFDPRGMLGAALEAAAKQEPGRTTAILERLLSVRDKPLARYDLVQHAPGIIAAALDSSDPDTIVTARKVMDLLGRSGHIRIAELVEQRRRG